MTRDEIQQKVLEALESKSSSHGIDIVDVELVGPAPSPVVRIRIDTSDEAHSPIDLESVTAQSSWISEALDELDPLPSSYTLEVSSPGLDRPLRTPRDFERFAGSKVRIQTKADTGRKRYSGTLMGFSHDMVYLKADDGDFSIALSDIKSARIQPEFD